MLMPICDDTTSPTTLNTVNTSCRVNPSIKPKAICSSAVITPRADNGSISGTGGNAAPTAAVMTSASNTRIFRDIAL